jgi:hypothetical protein
LNIGNHREKHLGPIKLKQTKQLQKMLQVTVLPFSLVGPGQTAHGQAGFVSPTNASYTASITNDRHSIFKVTEISATRATLEYVDDSGGDPGDGVKIRHHRPVPVWVDEPVGATNGATPLKVQTGDKLVIKVQMVCPNDPADTYLATLTITSSNSGDTTNVSLSVPTGQVDVQVLNIAATAAPGIDATWLLSVRSVAGAGGNISFSPDPGGAGSLAGPPVSVSIPPITAFLPRRGNEMLALKASVADVTPPGSYGFFVAEKIFDRDDTLFSPFSLSLKVTNPQVVVASNQPSTFYMVAGSEIQFVLDVQLKGTGTILDLTINPTAQGLMCTFLDAQGKPIPKWHLNLTTKEQIQLPVRVSVDPGGAPSPASLTFSWSAYDGTEQGSLGFDITMLPSQVTQSRQIDTPAGTALGGTVTMTLWSNGNYSVQFHMHDSGVPDYDFQVRAIFTTPGGLSLVSAHNGHVEGTVSTTLTHAPNRDDDYTSTGHHPFIQLNWPDILRGTLWVTKDYSATGIIGVFDDLAKAVLDGVAGAAGGTIGVVIGLGSEIGQLFGNLGLGGTFGVIGGVVVFAFSGSLVLATVAGIAIGLVTNALIKQRQISQAEYDLANNGVFKGTLPPPDHIILTNLSGLGGRAFTMPGIDGKIYVNLGDAYGDPVNYTPKSYPAKGQLLVHELTHAWQIHHASFLPGFVCQGIVNQANFTVGQDVYQYGPSGQPWSAFNLEQQGAIVDQWFGGDRPEALGRPASRAAMDPNDAYFGYIASNIRLGRP